MRWTGDDSTVDAVAANNGAWVGTPAYAPGVLDHAFSSDGASYLAVPAAASHYPSSSFTASLSAKTAVTSDRQMFMASIRAARARSTATC